LPVPEGHIHFAAFLQSQAHEKTVLQGSSMLRLSAMWRAGLKGRVQAVEYIHTTEAAAMIGCSDQMVRNLARDSQIFGMRLSTGGYMKIERASVVAFIQRRQKAGLSGGNGSKSSPKKRRA
jgi:hypothetical protein